MDSLPSVRFSFQLVEPMVGGPDVLSRLRSQMKQVTEASLSSRPNMPNTAVDTRLVASGGGVTRSRPPPACGEGTSGARICSDTH